MIRPIFPPAVLGEVSLFPSLNSEYITPAVLGEAHFFFPQKTVVFFGISKQHYTEKRCLRVHAIQIFIFMLKQGDIFVETE
jgi:hypothetical protein